mmetsp:Transcript_9471/g.16516  ORF Transcript_9471/g.16516 Transcript_9471/m.16516 type:complete len:728 (-) Transcript_9471:56-2239(-)
MRIQGNILRVGAMKLVIASVLLSSWSLAEAGHCYGIAEEQACTGNTQGSKCAWCNGKCQMSYDVCAKIIPQDQLPGDPFFEDFSHLLQTNPIQKNYGVSVTDIDADGSFEFVVAGFGVPNQAHKWNSSAGKFQDVALGNEVLQDSSGRAIGVAACDVDGDGFEELYILNTDQYSGQTQTSDKLVDRDSYGHYSDIFTEDANQAEANYVAGRSCACVDRLGTGRYGVFVANYGGPMRLFEMPEGGRLVKDKAPDVGMDKTTGGRALIAGPIVTNRMDVFANNEGYGGGRLLEENSANPSKSLRKAQRRLGHRLNFFFTNDGAGSFEDIAGDVGLLDASQTGRGTTLLDSNGDGLLDIVYGNWNGPHRLFIQEKDEQGCPKFVDEAPSNMTTPSPIRTVIVADFDNDGYEEIFWNNIPGANRLFRKLPSDSNWTQVKIGDALLEEGMGTGGAVGDFDGDGKLELVVAHGESGDQPLSLFRPVGGSGNHWLRVLPLTAQGAPARGATVSCRAGGRTQLRVIDAGSGYLCQMEPVAHFGLGSLTSVDSITVTWPDGASHAITNPSVDQNLRVARPSGLTAPPFRGYCHKPAPTPAPESEPEPEPAPEPEPVAVTAAPVAAAPAASSSSTTSSTTSITTTVPTVSSTTISTTSTATSISATSKEGSTSTEASMEPNMQAPASLSQKFEEGPPKPSESAGAGEDGTTTSPACRVIQNFHILTFFIALSLCRDC